MTVDRDAARLNLNNVHRQLVTVKEEVTTLLQDLPVARNKVTLLTEIYDAAKTKIDKAKRVLVEHAAHRAILSSVTDERNKFRNETRLLNTLGQVECVEDFVVAVCDLKVDDGGSSSSKKPDIPPESGAKNSSSHRAPPGGRQGSMVPRAAGGGVGMEIG